MYDICTHPKRMLIIICLCNVDIVNLFVSEAHHHTSYVVECTLPFGFQPGEARRCGSASRWAGPRTPEERKTCTQVYVRGRQTTKNVIKIQPKASRLNDKYSLHRQQVLPRKQTKKIREEKRIPGICSGGRQTANAKMNTCPQVTPHHHLSHYSPVIFAIPTLTGRIMSSGARSPRAFMRLKRISQHVSISS